VADNPGVVGNAAVERGRAQATQHFNSIATTSANLDISNQQKSINATIADQKNTLQGLARQPGGDDTPEFKSAIEQLQASYKALTAQPAVQDAEGPDRPRGEKLQGPAAGRGAGRACRRDLHPQGQG
jgi:hypothetical protein